MKADATIVVLLARGLEIKSGERDFADVFGGKIKQSLADDGVVSQFQLATVLENQQGRFLRRIGNHSRSIRRVVRVKWGSIVHRRNVGRGAGSSTVEDGGTALVVVIPGVGVLIRGADADGVGDGDGIDYRRRGCPIVMTAMMAVGVA